MTNGSPRRTAADYRLTVTGMVRTLRVDVDLLRRQASAGFTLATEVADWLSRRGVPFAQAHEITDHDLVDRHAPVCSVPYNRRVGCDKRRQPISQQDFDSLGAKGGEVIHSDYRSPASVITAPSQADATP